MAKWEDINQDILSQILKIIKDPSDHIRCSAVCSSWRSAALHHRYTLQHSIPGLIVSPRYSLNRTFLDFRTNSPPFIYDHDHDHDLDVSCFDTCVGSYQGWVLLTSHDNSSVYVQNPFLNRRRFLPTLGNKKIYKGIFSSSPSFDPKCIVLILFQSENAAFCYVGDDSWKKLTCQIYNNLAFSDALFFQGKFYVVDDYGKIYTLDFDHTILVPIKSQPLDISETVRYKFYLVEVQGQLCRVQRKFEFDENFFYKNDVIDDDVYETQTGYRVSTREFWVLRMDPGTNEWVRVNNLGGDALFLGCNNSICVSEIELNGNIKGNKIYFTDDRQKNSKHFGMDSPGKDMGIYDMNDLNIEPVYLDPWYELMDEPPAVWVTPLPW
ncbi:hypothetical protein RND81_06G241700 [Saponaria officinalis]|uniref:F-box protein n=1 Tax=Saponaria officinalis TaxID=3572 RepID=A0AAW1KEB4_SAPOF